MKKAVTLLTLFAFTPLAIAASSDPQVAEAEALLAKRLPNAAYKLLAPLEDEKGGDPDFDYVFGQAALESGRASEAAFAFERCLAVDPKNGPCRVMMARTHLALGENNSARKELQTVNDSQPPVEVQGMVAQYLGALKQREVSEQRSAGLWAQVGLGYDGNVNSATADSNVVFPALPGMVWNLNAAGVQQSDVFVQAAAGGSVQSKLSPAWRFLADVGVNNRSYQDWDVYASTALDAGVGLAWNTGPNSVLLKLQQQAYYKDHDRYRNYTGLMAQYQHSLSEAAGVSAYVQGSQLDYRNNRADADRYVVGLGYSQAFTGTSAPAVYVGLYGGSETAEGNNPQWDQMFYGLRFGGSMGTRTLRYTASASIEQRQFDGSPLPLWMMKDDQKDTQFDMSLGAIYQVTKQFSLRPAYTFTTSSSNNPLADYDRHVVNVDFRFEL